MSAKRIKIRKAQLAKELRRSYRMMFADLCKLRLRERFVLAWFLLTGNANLDRAVYLATGTKLQE